MSTLTRRCYESHEQLYELHRKYAVRCVHEGKRVDEAGSGRRPTRAFGASISFGDLAR